MNTTIIGTTNVPNLWTYKLVVTETATDTINRTSTIKVEHFLGRKSGAGSSYFNGAYTISSTVNGETKSSNKNTGGQNVNVSNGGWKSIGSHTFTVSNTGNPTTITISGTQTSTIFNPSSSSANGTMDLTVLHLPPEITNIAITERDARLTTLSLDNSTIVSFLSQKRFTITATPNDGATITTYKVYYGSTELGTSNTNVVDCNFANISLSDGVITINVIDNQGGVGVINVTYPIIQYQKPTLSNTSIKRKTDNQTGLIDGEATLKLNGTFYKEANIIGNANTIKKVEYKIWNVTEPNFIDITSSSTIGSGTVTSSYTINELNDKKIEFDKTYEYKIIITDYFDNVSNLIEGKVPTGLAVWTEFKDRVDFIKLSINNQSILAPYVLYDNNTSRTDTDITLIDSSANYDYLEIYYNYYAGSVEHYNMVKIDEPNGKVAMLMGMYDNETYMYNEIANYTINGSTLERTSAARWRYATGGGNSTRVNTTSNDPSIWITKVVGYK